MIVCVVAVVDTVDTVAVCCGLIRLFAGAADDDCIAALRLQAAAATTATSSPLFASLSAGVCVCRE